MVGAAPSFAPVLSPKASPLSGGQYVVALPEHQLFQKAYVSDSAHFSSAPSRTLQPETMSSTRVLRFNSLPKSQSRTKRLNWLIASFMVLLHVGAVAALFFFTWNALFVAIFLYWAAGSLGIGIGYH